MWTFSSSVSGKLNIFQLWAKQDIWRRHLGLWETLIDIVAPFYRPNIRWINQENDKLILHCIPTSSLYPFLSFCLSVFLSFCLSFFLSFFLFVSLHSKYSWKIFKNGDYSSTINQWIFKLSTIKSRANSFDHRLVCLSSFLWFQLLKWE